MTICKFFIPIVLISLISGCGGGDGGPPRATIQGSVTFDGEPVEAGFIEFIPVVGVNAAPVKLTIASGAYNSATDPLDNRGVPIGNHKVVITSWKETGKEIKNVMGEMEQEVLQFIPEKYNTNSELKAEVTAQTSELNFELSP